MFRSTRLTASLLLAVLAACDPASAPLTPPLEPLPPPLTPGVWHLVQADGQPLPAYVAHRLVGGQLEQVYVDSARIELDQQGRWTQSIFRRVLRDGQLQYREVWFDQGVSTPSAETYTFTSNGGSRVATVNNRTAGRLDVIEPMVVWPGSGLVASRYEPRRSVTVPPGDSSGTVVTMTAFRAVSANGAALPAVVLEIDDEPAEGNGTRFLLDSAWVSLSSDGTYRRTVAYSEWQSPNPALGLGWTKFGSTRRLDWGSFTRNDKNITLTSAYFQNFVVTGELRADGKLLLQHGLEPRDEMSLTVSYDRIIP